MAKNKVLALVETDSDPHLITVTKEMGKSGHPKDTKKALSVLQVFSAYSHPPEQLYQ